MDFFVNRILNLDCFPLLYVFGLAAIIGFTYYYMTSVVEEPRLHCKEGNFKRFLYRHVPLTKKKIWPFVLGYEAHINSLIAFCVRHLFVPSVKYDRELLDLKDGGRVALDILEPNENSKNGDVTILVMPGLANCSQTGYVRATSLALQKSGFRVVVFNYRGVGGIKLMAQPINDPMKNLKTDLILSSFLRSVETPRGFTGDDLEDVTEVVNHVKQKYPETILGGLGTSLGSTLLGIYMCSNEQYTHKRLSAAMFVSTPWNTHSIAASLSKNIIPRITDFLVTRWLINYVKNNSKVLNCPNQKWSYNDVIRSKTGKEFARNYSIKMLGYNTVEDFYDSITLHDKIDRFNVPCLCLSAVDDPVDSDIPVELASTTENVAILSTARGGHIGFFENVWPFSAKEEFMICLIRQYFEAIFKNDNYKQFTN